MIRGCGKLSCSKNRASITSSDGSPVHSNGRVYSLAPKWLLRLLGCSVDAVTPMEASVFTDSALCCPSKPNSQISSFLKALNGLIDQIKIANNQWTPLPATKAKIVLVADSLGSGGAQRQWLNLAIAMRRKGIDARLLVFTCNGERGTHRVAAENAGVPLIVLEEFTNQVLPKCTDHEKRLLSGFPMPEKYKMLLPSLVVLLRRLSPTHLITQKPFYSTCVSTAAHIAGVKRILISFRTLSLPTVQPNDPGIALYCETFRALAQSPSVRFCANSRAGRRDNAKWLKLEEEQIDLVTNLFDVNELLGREDTDFRRHLEERLKGRFPIIAGIFRISSDKDPELFLETIALLKKRYPKLAVVHVGATPRKKGVRFRRAIARFGLKDTVFPMGVTRDIESVMNASDLIMLTSRYEGTPNALIEAHAFGLPIVTTAAGDADQIVRNGISGYVITTRSAANLADACARILSLPDLGQEMGKKGREHVLKAFDPNRSTNRFLELLEIT